MSTMLSIKRFVSFLLYVRIFWYFVQFNILLECKFSAWLNDKCLFVHNTSIFPLILYIIVNKIGLFNICTWKVKKTKPVTTNTINQYNKRELCFYILQALGPLISNGCAINPCLSFHSTTLSSSIGKRYILKNSFLVHIIINTYAY